MTFTKVLLLIFIFSLFSLFNSESYSQEIEPRKPIGFDLDIYLVRNIPIILHICDKEFEIRKMIDGRVALIERDTREIQLFFEGEPDPLQLKRWKVN
jgi:hypothetical protein